MTRKSSAIIGQAIIWGATIIAMSILTNSGAPLAVVIPILSFSAFMGMAIQAASLRAK